MKHFLCALAVAAALMLCAACGSRAVSADSEIAATAPTASSSRNVRSAPVDVTEQAADAETVGQTPTPSDAASEAPTATPAGQTSEAEAETETPATGDVPVAYVAAILGLILLCSAGLVMLRRI